jgi:hypothetical protein
MGVLGNVRCVIAERPSESLLSYVLGVEVSTEKGLSFWLRTASQALSKSARLCGQSAIGSPSIGVGQAPILLVAIRVVLQAIGIPSISAITLAAFTTYAAFRASLVANFVFSLQVPAVFFAAILLIPQNHCNFKLKVCNKTT